MKGPTREPRTFIQPCRRRGAIVSSRSVIGRYLVHRRLIGREGPAALPIFSHSTLLSSPSLQPKMHFFHSRWANSNGLCMQAHGNYLVVISSRKFRSNWPSVKLPNFRWWTSILQTDVYILSLSLSLSLSLCMYVCSKYLTLDYTPGSYIIKKRNLKIGDIWMTG